MAWVPAGAQPTLLALVLALVSLPIVAATWNIGYRDQYIGGAPIGGSLAWSGSAGGVFLSALIAGPLGGLVVRRNRTLGAGLTFWLAFIVAIIGAQLLPAYLGQSTPCHTSMGVSCDLFVTTGQVVIEDVQSFPLLMLFGSLAEPVAILTLAVGVIFWAAVLGPSKPSHKTARREGRGQFAW